MTETRLAKTEKGPVAASYLRLRERVRQVLLRGQQRASALVESELIRTSWQVGRLIDRDIRAQKKTDSDRAAYGTYVVRHLAEDLGRSRTQLYASLKFARTYPIVPRRGQLKWSHYRVLVSVPDEEERKAFGDEASRLGWTWEKLAEKIQDRKKGKKNEKPHQGAGRKVPNRFIPKRGQLHTYRVLSRRVPLGFGREAAGSKKPALVLDLGFYFYDEALGTRLGRFREGDIVRADFVGANPFARKASFSKIEGIPKSHLYTYTALLERVVDIDTFWMYIQLGFGMAHRQKLRLRGVDGPELGTSEGDQAKRWVEERLKGVETFTVTTTKPDKWARYLADIYFKEGGEEVNLNQLLLQEGLVRRKEDYSAAGWRKWEGKGG